LLLECLNHESASHGQVFRGTWSHTKCYPGSKAASPDSAVVHGVVRVGAGAFPAVGVAPAVDVAADVAVGARVQMDAPVVVDAAAAVAVVVSAPPPAAVAAAAAKFAVVEMALLLAAVGAYCVVEACEPVSGGALTADHSECANAVQHLTLDLLVRLR